MYRRSIDEPAAFWAEAAGELEWFAPWVRVLGRSDGLRVLGVVRWRQAEFEP